MGTGYTRKDTVNNIADGNIINAADLDLEFDGVEAAFDAATGHTHDGTTGEGAPIEVTGPAQEYVSTGTELRPKTNNTYDLGSASLQWKDLYVDGTANLDTVDIDAGAIDGTVIGGATPAAGTFTTLTATGNVTLGDAATDTVTITADVASNIIPSADNTYDLGASGSEWKDLYIDGTANIDSLVADTADINGGTIDGVTIGGASAGAGTFTNVTATGTINLSGATVSNGGTVTTVDINGGTIDGTVIGGSTPAAISGTTGQFGTSLNVDGTVTADGLTVDKSGSTIITTLNRLDSISGYINFKNTGTTTGFVGYESTDFVVYADNVKVLQASDGGDISFYEDTGTTPQMVWDASADALTFGDNVKATFGAGSDLQIYHDGANSNIKDAGTGPLKIFATDLYVNNSAGNKTHLSGIDGGAVTLFHNGAAKLATTATGIDVTGTVTADGLTSSGNLTFDAVAINTINSNGFLYFNVPTGYTHTFQTNGVINLQVSNGDALFYEDTGTTPKMVWRAADERLGIGTSSPDNLLTIQTGTYANAYVPISNLRYNAFDVLKFGFTGAGGSIRTGTIDTGNYGFAVNTGDGSERLRIDASGNVGIGTSSPGRGLHTSGDVVRFDNAGTSAILLLDTTNNEGFRIVTNKDSGAFSIEDMGTAVSGSGTERLRIDASGNVGIGVSNPASYDWANTIDLVVGNTSGSSGLSIVSSTTSGGNIAFADGTTGNERYRGYIYYDHASDYMSLWTAATERMRIDASGNLLLAGTGTPTSSAGNLVIYNGTAPTGNATNGVILYAEDVSASSELKVRDEAGNVTTLSPHNFDLIPEGPSEDMAWSYYSERDGKRINVDMLKAIRLLEQISGEKLVHMV